MLAISFFALIFSSLMWLIFSLRFISDSLGATALFAASLPDMITYALLVCLPIFLMWMVFSYINQYLQNRNVNSSLQKLFVQMKKNQDYSDLVARVLIETEQQVKSGFALSRFDLLVADMNELLAEIIRLCNIASNEQIEHLWKKVQNGGKWSFGKVIVEVNGAQENFQMRVYEKACHDVVLSGTLMEFCARYLAVVNLLEKHDHEKVFLNIMETGVMGKVFSIFAPIADEVRKNRESSANFRSPQKPAETFKAPEVKAPQPAPIPQPTPRMEEPKKSLLGKIFKKKEVDYSLETATSTERDPFTMALERSFGEPVTEEPQISMVSAEPQISISTAEPMLAAPSLESETFSAVTIDEPKFEISAPVVEQEESILTDTQKTLNNIKKEWAEIKIKNEPTLSASWEQPRKEEKTKNTEEENFAYPFGGWVDEQNYK